MPTGLMLHPTMVHKTLLFTTCGLPVGWPYVESVIAEQSRQLPTNMDHQVHGVDLWTSTLQIVSGHVCLVICPSMLLALRWLLPDHMFTCR